MKSKIGLLAVAVIFLAMAGIALAAPTITFVSPIVSNLSYFNTTSITINITSDQGLNHTGHFIEWYNDTTASYINVTPTNATIVNMTGANLNATITGFNASVARVDYNYSIYLVNETGQLSNTGVAYFVIYDGLNPSFYFAPGYSTFQQYNTSSMAGMNISFTTVERNNDTAAVRIYQENGAMSTKFATLTKGNLTDHNYTVNITSSDLSQDGDVIVEFWANDSSVRSAVHSTNLSMSNTFLKAGWNMITKTDPNETTYSLCEKIPYCTHVSVVDNSMSNKNFTNYARATVSVNNNTDVTFGNSTFVYVSSDVMYLRDFNLTDSDALGTENITLFPYNQTGGNYSGWNAFGLYRDRTINQTLYMHTNVTGLAFYNSSTGYYVQCDTAWEYCGGGYLVNQTIPKTWSLWLLLNGTALINRTLY